jgi:hypothetical protein
MKHSILILLLILPKTIIAQVDTTFLSSIYGSDKTAWLQNDSLRNRGNIHFIFATSLQVDFQINDFSKFTSLLGDYNVELMNNSIASFDCELNGFLNNIMVGLNFGFQNNSNYDHDSLDLEFNNTNFGLHFGYKLLDSKHFILVPQISLEWGNYRLINSDNESKIPLSQYTSERDLDLRFNQLTAFAGFKIAYKFHYKYPWVIANDYMSIGLYGGYLIKLNQKPWIYSLRNRLTTNDKIDVNNFGFGLSVTFYLDNK